MMNQNVEEGRRWLSQAQFDLNSGRWSLEGGFYADTCFKSQQAAEKAVKFYTSTRYPDAVPDGAPYEFFTREEAEEALDWASQILTFMSGELPLQEVDDV